MNMGICLEWTTIQIILEKWSALFTLRQTQTPGGDVIISIVKGIIILGWTRGYGNRTFKGDLLDLLPFLHQVPDMSLSARDALSLLPDFSDGFQVQASKGIN